MTATSTPSISIAVRVESGSKPRPRATLKCGCRARLRRRSSRLEAVAAVALPCGGNRQPLHLHPHDGVGVAFVLGAVAELFAAARRRTAAGSPDVARRDSGPRDRPAPSCAGRCPGSDSRRVPYRTSTGFGFAGRFPTLAEYLRERGDIKVCAPDRSSSVTRPRCRPSRGAASRSGWPRRYGCPRRERRAAWRSTRRRPPASAP